ncbi:MAG TPA: hypothetical protein VGF62_07700 [Rhizomicrobium sp.]
MPEISKIAVQFGNNVAVASGGHLNASLHMTMLATAVRLAIFPV